MFKFGGKNYTQPRLPTMFIPYTKEVTIHEHKAPTDKALELLKEMREETEKSIIAEIRVESTTLKEAVILVKTTPMRGRKIVLKFKLNGEDIVLTRQQPEIIQVSISEAEKTDKLFESFAEDLAKIILSKAIKTAERRYY